MLKKIIPVAFLFLSSLSQANVDFHGVLINHELDYPEFIGECAALLSIHIQGGENLEVLQANYETYMNFIDNLDSEQDKEKSYNSYEAFTMKLSSISNPTNKQAYGFRSDMSSCAYWTGKKKYYYENY